MKNDPNLLSAKMSRILEKNQVDVWEKATPNFLNNLGLVNCYYRLIRLDEARKHETPGKRWG